MSKNFITLLFTSRFPNRSPFCFQSVRVKRGYLWNRTTFLCATAYPKSKKLQVQSSKFQVCFTS